MKKQNQEKKWTIMLYLAGDNNLSDEMIWALKEIYRVGTGNTCNVVVQFDPSSPHYGPRRYNIGQLESMVQATADVDGIVELAFLKKALEKTKKLEDSSDPSVLKDFLRWTFTQRKKMAADHYMLILSGHGNGAGGYFLQDDDPKSNLTIVEFGKVLRDVCGTRRKIQILGLDCCAMSTAELAHEVCEEVNYIVGAEGFTHNAGWPYHRLLETLRERPSPSQLAEEIAGGYFRYYSDYLAAEVSADQSVIHLASPEWGKLIGNFRRLSQKLNRSLLANNDDVKNALILAHWSAQSFEYEQNTDLYDFCAQLLVYLKDEREIKKICRDITNPQTWKKLVPLSLYSGPEYQHAHGISLYFPWSEVAAGYEKLRFAKDTGWGEFLKTYIRKTCREIRIPAPEYRGPAQRPKTLEPKFKNKFIGNGGWPAYRPNGLDRIESYGLDSVRGGGIDKSRGGGPDISRGGGPDISRGGGPDVARAIARLCSMKNFPAGFFQPPYKKISNINELETECTEAHAHSLLDRLRNGSQRALAAAFQGLTDEEKDAIEDILNKTKP